MKRVPEGFSTISAHLTVRGAARAIEFYKEAFDAREVSRMMMPDGSRILYAELQIGDSRLMLCDEMPDQKLPFASPQSTEKTTVLLHIYVENPDQLLDRAVRAGAKITMPMMDAFWGDRYGMVTDPFGHVWALAAHIKDLSPVQIEDAAKSALTNLECAKRADAGR
jgi:uncharacterized glyoxalase superfamily protein PhnB